MAAGTELLARVPAFEELGPAELGAIAVPRSFAVGEVAMFDDELRSATVEATEELAALAILGSDMRRLMREHPEIAARLAVVISQGRGRLIVYDPAALGGYVY